MSAQPQGGNQVQAQADSGYVKLKVVGQEATEIHFRVKTTTPMGRLKLAFAERTGVPSANIRLLFDGRRLGDTDTAGQLEMEDDDVIEAFVEQTGGGGK